MRILRSAMILVVLAALAGGGYWTWRTYVRAQDDGPLTLYGNVDVRQVDLAFNAEGKIAEIPVEEGDRVEKGQVLARLDSDTYENMVAAAEARLEESRARLTELENGTRPQEIERARAAVEQAEARVRMTRITRERRERLRGPSYVSESAYDEAVRAHEEAKAELRQRRAELDLAVEGPRTEKIAAARAQVAFNEATLRLARERLDNTTLTAPEAGTVLTRVREPGATVGPTATVMTLALREPMRVRTYVSETNLGQVEPGMPVAITTDSFPDKVYEGHVGFISPTAEFTPKTVQTPELRTSLVYRVRVIVDNPDAGLRQGMPVTIELRAEGETGS
ncbi:HlyD family secretion protein [Limimonas halophila]|uniref:HlyD family secretion protein n=1 Tax=Limimonas halophila TaxID=1082479 RepID=A0A1G7Q0M8_9PROT|nr:efflux RND transporter periplasmic adaptor subunit [Limimonas halophila]SDF92008.1 HlyD family secretion protein [Limimonas halophila]